MALVSTFIPLAHTQPTELTKEEIAAIDAAGAKGPDTWFTEAVVPKVNIHTRAFSLMVLAAVSLAATIALYVGGHIFNLM